MVFRFPEAQPVGFEVCNLLHLRIAKQLHNIFVWMRHFRQCNIACGR